MQPPIDSPSFVVRQWNQIQRARAAWILALLLVVIQGVVELKGGWMSVQAWYTTLGLNRPGVMSGKLWQLVTHALLHGNGWHVGINAMLLVGVGSRVEAILGARGLLRVVLLGVFVGGLFHLCFSQALLVGVSGACFALMLLLTTLSPESRMFPLPLSAKSLGWGIVIAEIGFAFINPALGIPGLQSLGELLVSNGLGGVFQVSHACHLGGALAGLACGRWLLRSPVTLEDLRRQRAKREGASSS